MLLLLLLLDFFHLPTAPRYNILPAFPVELPASCNPSTDQLLIPRPRPPYALLFHSCADPLPVDDAADEEDEEDEDDSAQPAAVDDELDMFGD